MGRKKMPVLMFMIIIAGLIANSPAAYALKVLPTGGGYDVTCGDLGIQMRDSKVVRSCLLGLPGDFPYGISGQSVPCAEKYAAAFRPNGDLEYCTLGLPAVVPRTATEVVTCRPGGRITFRENGSVESCALGADFVLPWKKNATVTCKGWFPCSFRSDGNVSTCVLAEEAAFLTGKKKTLNVNCKVGGLIAFDEDGTFSGCYPPPPPKSTPPQATDQTNSETKPGGNE